MLKNKLNVTAMKKINWTQFMSRKRINDELNFDLKKKKYNYDEEKTKNELHDKSAKSNLKIDLPLIIKDRAYGRLISTNKYFTNDEHLTPQFSQIIQPGSKLQLSVKELRDLFCIFSQFKELDEFYTFAQYFFK